MEPRIDTNDGFVAIPAVISGDPNPGDVIVYETAEGELVTHRIVDETAEGYVTRGDANPVTDQDRGDELVTETRIVAKALQFDGHVLTIPWLGLISIKLTAVLAATQRWLTNITGIHIQGNSGVATAVFVVSFVGYLFELVRDKYRSPSDTQDRPDDTDVEPHRLVVACTLFVVICVSAAMLVPGGAKSMTLVSTQPAPEGDLIAEPGGSTEATYRIANSGYTPIVTYLESGEGVDLSREVVVISARNSTAVQATLEAPNETGHFGRTIRERRYLYVLPRSLLGRLYDANPWLPFGVIVSLIGGVIYAFARVMVVTADEEEPLSE
jgi:signal peptidase